jgi:hypothetical protein
VMTTFDKVARRPRKGQPRRRRRRINP